MLVEFGRANLLEKARQQPDKVLAVFDKIKADGLMPTVESVRNKLDQPLPMGYCNAGVVVEVGAEVTGFSVGARIASNGKHAEMVCVPKNLCARIPDGVSDEAATFTVIGAIALQGIRLAQPTLGEAVVVVGLGLIGLVAVQLRRAHGCRVLGVDFDSERLALARTFGANTVDLSRAEDPVAAAMTFSRGCGVDAVLITASTKSNEPVHQSAAMCRKRGRIVLVGVVGLGLSRADFYEKELSFQVSCSYGPGRYDAQYEEAGHDYPLGFVRWTEQRNFEAVLDMLADRRLDVAPLISHRFPLDEAEKAYKLAVSEAKSLGIMLQYPEPTKTSIVELRNSTVRLVRRPEPGTRPMDAVAVGVIGSGSYATQVLIPAFRDAGAVLRSVASQAGVSAAHAGKKFGFETSTTDTAALLSDPEINTVVVATRHNTHARYVCEALRSGRHVFVEKPLAIRREELADIESAIADATTRNDRPLLMVGFNRRFAPQVQKIKGLLAAVPEPKSFVMTVNAGAISPAHWTQDPDIGGGRIIGEGCHFIDLLRFLADASISSVRTTSMGGTMGGAGPTDSVSFSMTFADGSLGTVHYLSNGHKSFPKERLEVFCAGRILQLDNFRTLTGFGWPGFGKMNLWRQDKGNRACAATFIDAVRQGGPSPIPVEELLEVTRVTFDIVDQLR